MNTPLRIAFLLDSPNVHRGQALAGTPARTLALARGAADAGAEVVLVLGDRGCDLGTASDWSHAVVTVHPHDFYSPAALASVLAPVRPDLVVQCEAEALVAMGRDLADLLGAVLVYDVHDDDAAVASSLGSSAEVVAAHASAQRAAFAVADRVVVSTRNEATLATSSGVSLDDLAMVPNGCDPDGRRAWGPDPASFTVLFLGNLYYEPNARAVGLIRDTIAPVVRRQVPNAEFRIVGRSPVTPGTTAGGLHFTGPVESIDEATWSVSLALAPLTAGSGAKMKILDYLVAGLPVLGTSEAVTGLAPDHPGVIVDDDITGWPDRIVHLLHSPDELFGLSNVGRAAVVADFAWPVLGASFVNHCARWTASPRPAGTQRHQLGTLTPRWLTEHADQGALGLPSLTSPGIAHWVRRTKTGAGAREA